MIKDINRLDLNILMVVAIDNAIVEFNGKEGK